MGRGASIGVFSAAAALVLAPIIAGFAFGFAASLGFFPAIGADHLTFAPYHRLMAVPEFWGALGLSLQTGGVATALSLLLALIFVAQVGGESRILAPLLAIPHAAIALGLAFLIAPSGWIMRALAPLLGFDRPPDLALVNDPAGFALILGLVIKETPFLVIAIASAMAQLPVIRTRQIGASLGYGTLRIWALLILPQLYPLIRLPVMVVLAYGLSVVDMALILGPNAPPTFAVLVTRLFIAPDLTLLLPAFAGAMVQIATIALACLSLWLCERGLMRLAKAEARMARRGGTRIPLSWITPLPRGIMGLGLIGVAGLLLWSITWRWVWPDVFPQSLSLRAWQSGDWGAPLQTSLEIAVISLIIATPLALLTLEAVDHLPNKLATPILLPLIYTPLLMPQIGFLYGVNIAALKLGITAGVAPVIWAHLLFVYPYILLLLLDPWRAIDRRVLQAAADLGAGPWRRFFAVKLPLMLRAIMVAMAVGFAVSIAQYLPTLFVGGGRVATITTEAVTLASGGDRRITGVYGSLQAALPLLVYLLAFLTPRYVWRNRRAMQARVT